MDRATERGGVLDRLSALQTRMQKDLERDREAYFKWQRRRRRAEARGHPDESEEDSEEPEDSTPAGSGDDINPRKRTHFPLCPFCSRAWA